jgi:hypothetical protein
MQELHISVKAPTGQQRKKKGSKRGFMDKAVIYCLFMCTALDVAVLALYWHSVTAPDSLAIAAMAAPWMVEFGAMASIKNKKPKNTTDNNTKNEGE